MVLLRPSQGAWSTSRALAVQYVSMLVESLNNMFIPDRRGNWDLLEKGQQLSIMNGEDLPVFTSKKPTTTKRTPKNQKTRDKAVPESPIANHGNSPRRFVCGILCTKTGRMPGNKDKWFLSQLRSVTKSVTIMGKGAPVDLPHSLSTVFLSLQVRSWLVVLVRRYSR